MPSQGTEYQLIKKNGFVDLKNTPRSFNSGFWILLKMPFNCFISSVAKSQYYFAMLYILWLVIDFLENLVSHRSA